MKTVFALILAMATSNAAIAQNLVNQYEPSNLVPENYVGYNTGGSYYDGEFQIFFDDLFQLFAINPLESTTYEFRILLESVSLPFLTSAWDETNGYSRWLTLADTETFTTQPSELDEFILNESYQGMGATQNSRVYTAYNSFLTSNFQYSEFSSPKFSLESTKYSNLDEAGFEQYPTNRIMLTHSILRATLTVFCDGNQVAGYSMLLDLTRGMMRYYPFSDNLFGSNVFQYYDVQIRPRFHIDPNGHSYDAASNSNYYETDGSGTVNYMEWNEDEIDFDNIPQCEPPALPELASEPALGGQMLPPPYTLLDAVFLNHDATAFAGMDVVENEFVLKEDLNDQNYTNPIPLRFFIDKPFDLTTINPNERVIYLPSEMYVGKPIDTGTEIPTQFDGVECTFPSGYTFATVLGAYPARSVIEQMIAAGECTNWRDCFPPTDVEWSIINVEDGSVLNIEDCVALYDVDIHVKDGGTLNYDPYRVTGRYNIIDDGGTINETSPDNIYLFCNSECANTENYDALSLSVPGNETYTITDGTTILGNIEVEAGGILEIPSGVTLHMGPDAKIIVKNGGQLNAENATLTSACNQMWRGIEAWDLNNSTEPPAQTEINNCVIRNAHIAVLDGRTKLYGEFETDDDPVWYSNEFEAHSWGADIALTNNQFINCGIDVYHPDFISFFPHSANIHIEGNTFICTAVGLPDMRYNNNHPDAYPNEQYPWFGKANSETRTSNAIILGGAKDVVIGGDNAGDGNHFENIETGVRQIRSNCDVVNNTFDNLQYGIHINQMGHYWNTEQRTRISGNSFNDVFDPNPGELSELPIPGIEYEVGGPGTNDLTPFVDFANSACVRVEGMKQLEIKGNDFGTSDFEIGFVSNGVYLENCSGLNVANNRFHKNDNAIILWDTDDMDWGQALVGPESTTEFKNIFNFCDNNVAMGGSNMNLLLRCNIHNNGEGSGANWVNNGILGNQGSLPEDVNDDHAAAGNEFEPVEYRQILSMCLPCDYPAEIIDDQPEEYFGWAYYHHQIVDEETDGKFRPSDPIWTESDFVLGDIGIPFNPLSSCASPYEFQEPPSEHATWIASLAELGVILNDQVEKYQDMKIELDNYAQATQEMLSAIYGGITDEYELMDFLKDNSPLSNEVMRAYMERYNVPSASMLQVIEMNGEMDQSLRDLLDERVENMPATIRGQILALVMNNPEYESLAEIKQRIKRIYQVRNAALMYRINELATAGQSTQLRDLLQEEGSDFAVATLFALELQHGNLNGARLLLNSINATEEFDTWKSEATILLDAAEDGRDLSELTAGERETLLELHSTGISSESFSNVKAYLGLYAEFPMWIPLFIPVGDRSASDQFKAEVVPQVYPNPARHYLRIRYPMPENEVAEFRLADITGRLVHTSMFNSYFEDGLVELPHLSSGVYAYEIVHRGIFMNGKIAIR